MLGFVIWNAETSLFTKQVKEGFFFTWLHSITIYQIVYRKITYYKHPLFPESRHRRYFTFGREVKIRSGAILSLGVVGSFNPPVVADRERRSICDLVLQC